MHVTCFLQGGKADPGCTQPYYRDKQWALHTPVVFDAVPSGKKFGDVNTDAKSSYKLVGLDLFSGYHNHCEHVMQNESVVVEFWAGNPRNNLMVNISSPIP